MEKMKKSIKFSLFLVQANIVAKSIGLIPYEDESKPQKYAFLLKLIFVIQIINMNFVLITEIIYVLIAMAQGENFVEATMNLSYIGFVFVGDIKIFSVLQKKPLLSKLMREIGEIYPAQEELQRAFQLRRYVRNFNLISFGFVLIHEILIWSYNLYTAMSYLIYEYWLQVKIVPRILPYYCWVPWHWQGHWSYYILYVSQNLAGHTCMSGQLANDLLLCTVATQIIMHYEYLSICIGKYQPKPCYKENKKFLSDSIKYHQNVLKLSDYMNEVFGVSLLVNFISSSFIMCFLGFQMTIGVATDALIMLFMFLFCSLMQILMICNYGQELILKSENIGHAVYKHNWFHTDVRYRKMLVQIIQRSQKPALLKATSFLIVSMGTMTDLMQLSYKFFALIRTMYSK